VKARREERQTSVAEVADSDRERERERERESEIKKRQRVQDNHDKGK
jgi:hypothetical protein